jgi:hypothetical protein
MNSPMSLSRRIGVSILVLIDLAREGCYKIST